MGIFTRETSGTESKPIVTQLKETLVLLRFPFSFFLLPVSLFSLIFLRTGYNFKLFLALLVWYVLIFPASNGYNSYHDRDAGPIGGLRNPPTGGKLLLFAVNIMDLTAIILSAAIGIEFFCFILFYITASRLYSNRRIRLKQYPFLSFFIVTFFQGAWVFSSSFYAAGKELLLNSTNIHYAAIASSLFIATVYPLTQIYQHEADKADNVKTISISLGVKGTFLFCAAMFSLACFFVYMSFPVHQYKLTSLFCLYMLPAVAFFFYWTYSSFRNVKHVHFGNAMIMLILSSLANNSFFFTLLIL